MSHCHKGGVPVRRPVEHGGGGEGLDQQAFFIITTSITNITSVTNHRITSIDRAPRLSIRKVIWILASDTEASATTPPGVMYLSNSTDNHKYWDGNAVYTSITNITTTITTSITTSIISILILTNRGLSVEKARKLVNNERRMRWREEKGYKMKISLLSQGGDPVPS